ncbi:MAG: alpha/beta hydrolase [Telluria sp.]
MNIFLILLLIVAFAVAVLMLFSWRISRRVHAALPPKGRLVAVPGGTLHVREQGQGPALLLIHGLGGQMAHFDYGVAEQLADQFRVVTVDRPGSGYSTRAAGASADLSTQARDLAALIDTLELGPTIVAGHSLGGAVALTLALEHPRHVRAVALIAPLTHARDTVPEAFKALTIRSLPLRRLFAWTLAIPGTMSGSAKVLEQVFGPDPVPRDFAMRGGGLLSLRPSQFLAASADLQAVPERLPAIQARYTELTVPAAVLFGRDDRILDWKANGEAFVSKAPGAKLQLVDGGHMLPVTHPGLTVGFIRELAAVASMRDPAQGGYLRASGPA